MRFRYRAVGAQGQSFEGQVEAGSLRDAQRQLRAKGLTPVALDPVAAGGERRRGKAGGKDRALMARQLATLLQGGLSLVESIDSLAEAQDKADLAAALGAVARDLRRGRRFSTALREHLGGLPAYVHQLAEAGEAAGNLAGALTDAASQMDYDERVRNEIRTALTYPSLLVLFGTAAVLFIFVTVVPRFANMVQSSGADIPTLSRVVIGTGLFVRDNLLLLLLAGGGLLAGAGALLARPGARDHTLEALLRVPVLGSWLREAETGRWSAMLAALLGNRVPLLQALELARGALKLPGFRRQMLQVEKAVRGGVALSRAVEEHTGLERSSISLIRVGEKAGKLPEMLDSLATLHSQAGQTRMKRFLALVEPLAIISIGGVIGTIVVGIVLAITSTYDVAL